MSTINQFRSRLKSLSVKDESFHAVEETKDTITSIQKDQMLHGLNAEGEKIGRYRNNKYARVKNQFNPLPGLGVPDLKLTGAFYAGFKTEVTPETFKTTSTDKKSEALTEKYEPFGLNKESKGKYIKELRPVLVKKIKEKLQL